MGGLNLGGNWPELVSSHAVGGCSCILVALLLVRAGAAIMLDANGVVAVGPAVVAHVASVPPLFSLFAMDWESSAMVSVRSLICAG